MVLPHGSSSSNADAGGADAAPTGDAPRRFERAITWTRVAGAVAALLITPLFANLGLGYVFALAGFLVAWAVVLHILSSGASTAADQETITKVLGDVALIAFDQVSTGGLIGAYHVAQIFRVKLSRERGRIGQVAEHDGELAAFGLRGVICC